MYAFVRFNEEEVAESAIKALDGSSLRHAVWRRARRKMEIPMTSTR